MAPAPGLCYRWAMDAARFFDTALPQLAQEQAPLFAALHGRITFIVHDVGAWTVRLGDADTPVKHGVERDADLVLSFHKGAFADFLRGALDIKQALNDGDIAHEGDLTALTRFGRLLQTADVGLT